MQIRLITRCPFCSQRMPAVPVAIDEGWIPSYFVSDTEISDPVCPDCVAVHLRLGDDGEFEANEKGKCYA